MLKRDRVRRLEETDDVLQGALLRLSTALASVKPPTPGDFFALARLQMSRELCDLARHYFGPRGAGTNERPVGRPPLADTDDQPLVDDTACTHDPVLLAMWGEFHKHVEKLPEPEREVFGLVWYLGMTHDEAGSVLEISAQTVKRRYASARLLLQAAVPKDFLGL